MPKPTADNGPRIANNRAKIAPPVVPLAVLRKGKGITLQAVCDHINEEFDFPAPVERGTISAIENGHRGGSSQMLAAIASALGIEPALIDTNYQPRRQQRRRSTTDAA